jgi:hypothetical protein
MAAQKVSGELWQFYFLMISAYLLLNRGNKSFPNNIMELGLNIVLDCGHYMPYMLPASTSSNKP